ncbi:MAG TPA: elongation factor P [Planctomycetota bacterium]|nr:elongation factor P [Planctomycetota bacterium]
MAIRVTEAKKGMVIRYENDLYQITRYDHLTPGNLRAIHHLNLKHLKNGRQKEVRMKTSDQLDLVYLDSRDSQYLFKDSLGYTFMDNENFEQFVLSAEVIGDAMQYITENSNVTVVFCEGEALTVQLPPVVVVEVVQTEDAARGDTVSNVQKPARCNTGIEIKVPAHIKIGEKVKVNTDTGEFLGRA